MPPLLVNFAWRGKTSNQKHREIRFYPFISKKIFGKEDGKYQIQGQEAYDV